LLDWPPTMKLIPFADFPLHERDAVHAVLGRLRIPPRHVCVSRVEPVAGTDDMRLPTVVLVSAPGWSRAYEGYGWVSRMESDLAALPLAAHLRVDGDAASGPAPLGAR
jgi:hypothetical protein